MPRSRKSRYDADYRNLLSQLVARREAAAVTQVHLAERMGTSQSMLSKIERGVVRLDLTDYLDYTDGIGADPVAFLKDYIAATGWPKRRRVTKKTAK